MLFIRENLHTIIWVVIEDQGTGITFNEVLIMFVQISGVCLRFLIYGFLHRVPRKVVEVSLFLLL